MRKKLKRTSKRSFTLYSQLKFCGFRDSAWVYKTNNTKNYILRGENKALFIEISKQKAKFKQYHLFATNIDLSWRKITPQTFDQLLKLL